MSWAKMYASVRRGPLLPEHIGDKVRSSQKPHPQNLQIMCLIVVDGDPERAIFRQQPPE